MTVNNEFEITEKELKKFNWGACILGWIWGLLNKSYITLVQLPVLFIPIIGTFLSLGLSIWFGIKGNAWAYKNKSFSCYEEFISKQKKYAITGLFIILINIFTMIISLPLLHKLNIFYTTGGTSVDIYTANITQSLLKIITNINIALMLLLLMWVIDIKKTIKAIVISLILFLSFYITLIPTLEYFAEKAMSKTSYDTSIKFYEKLVSVIKIYPHLKQVKNPLYKDKIVFLYLIKNNLNKAIYWAESAEKDFVLQPIEENQLTSLYIFNGNYEKAIERGAKYKICLSEGDWNCAIKELNTKIDNPKGGKVYNGNVYANERYYLARAIAYKNLKKDALADKDYNTALLLNNSPDIINAYQNYKTYYKKLEFKN